MADQLTAVVAQGRPDSITTSGLATLVDGVIEHRKVYPQPDTDLAADIAACNRLGIRCCFWGSIGYDMPDTPLGRLMRHTGADRQPKNAGDGILAIRVGGELVAWQYVAHRRLQLNKPLEFTDATTFIWSTVKLPLVAWDLTQAAALLAAGTPTSWVLARLAAVHHATPPLMPHKLGR